MFCGLQEKELKEFSEIRTGGSGIVEDFWQVQPESYKGRYKVEDPGHGWMVVRQTDPGYLIAASLVEYGYRLKSGTILLEEDCEASNFLKQLK